MNTYSIIDAYQLVVPRQSDVGLLRFLSSVESFLAVVIVAAAVAVVSSSPSCEPNTIPAH